VLAAGAAAGGGAVAAGAAGAALAVARGFARAGFFAATGAAAGASSANTGFGVSWMDMGSLPMPPERKALTWTACRS
jgi:hypothetical protein